MVSENIGPFAVGLLMVSINVSPNVEIFIAVIKIAH